MPAAGRVSGADGRMVTHATELGRPGVRGRREWRSGSLASDHDLDEKPSRAERHGSRSSCTNQREAHDADGTWGRASASLVALRVSPRSLHNGQRVKISGRLIGEPRRQDASAILYALADRPIPVTSLKADSRGRFSFTYRFRSVARRSIFRFQVQRESRPGYPYAADASKWFV